jgi:membrane-associated phospholipid phosphatase
LHRIRFYIALMNQRRCLVLSFMLTAFSGSAQQGTAVVRVAAVAGATVRWTAAEQRAVERVVAEEKSVRWTAVEERSVGRAAAWDSAARIGENKFRPAALVLPAALISYGFIALNNPTLQSVDQHIRNVVWLDNPHHQLPLDNYLQYAPGAAVYLLNAFGVKGKNNLRDRTLIYLMANAFMGIAVESLKHTISAERPDGSGNDGFPSGHTGTAFAAAEFLRQEYKDVSTWYGIGGYAAAVATGYLRVYNDKHWFSELLPGAGIGILSAKAAYWIYPLIRKKWFKHDRIDRPALVALP